MTIFILYVMLCVPSPPYGPTRCHGFVDSWHTSKGDCVYRQWMYRIQRDPLVRTECQQIEIDPGLGS